MDDEIIIEPIRRGIDDVENKLQQINLNDCNLNFGPTDVEKADINEFSRSENKESKTKELKTHVTSQLNLYNSKYGTNLSFDGIQEYLRFSSLASGDEVAVRELVQGDLITQTSDYLIIKSILVMGKVLDDTLNNIQSKVYSDDVNMVSVGIIDKIFEWVTRLEEIKSRYKLHDLDASIKRTLEKFDKDEDVSEEDKKVVHNSIQSLLGRDKN